MGRGGAAFPTGRKWEATAGQPAPAALPGLQRRRERARHLQGPGHPRGRPVRPDRGHDHRGYAIGARARLHLPAWRVPGRTVSCSNAMQAARKRGYLGADILGTGFSFDLEIRRGAGAYICGEETAIFNSIEGYRGEPRTKPPFPVEVGLFGKPTVVNNVETLVQRAADLLLGRRRPTPRSAPRSRPAPSCSASPATGPPGRLRGAVRVDAAARCSRWPAGYPKAATCRRYCSAARPAASSAPTSSTSR